MCRSRPGPRYRVTRSAQRPVLRQLVVDAQHLGDRLVLGRPGGGLSGAHLLENLSSSGIAEQAYDGFGERLRIAVRNEFGRVADQFGDAPDRGRDERHARVEGLLREDGAGFPTAGQQRDLGGREELRDVVAPPDQPDGQSFVLDTALQNRPERPLPAITSSGAGSR